MSSNSNPHFIAGTIGGIISTAMLYPLEMIKTRMQVIDEKVYHRLSTSIVNVVKKEGFLGLYQGITPAIIGSAGSWGGYFFVYDLSKKRKLNSKESLGTYDHLLSGVEAGVVLVFTFNPIWVVKTRLVLQGAETQSKQKYKGLTDALVTIFKEEGIRGLYKGLVPALLLTSHGAIQFAVYEELKLIAESFRSKHEKAVQPGYISALIGGTSKIIASVITYPYQVIKSKLQQREIVIEGQPMHKRYEGTLDCVKQIWRKERFVGFFRGVVPNSLKVAPSSALTFLVYEESLKILKKFSTSEKN